MINSDFKILSEEMISFEKFASMISGKVRFPDTLGSIHEWIKNEYSKTNRAYHNLEHISDCLVSFSLFVQNVGHAYGNSQAIFTAIYFHDIIYSSRADNNEEASAAVAQSVLLSLGCSDSFIKNVKNLIMVTKHNRAPQTEEEKLIVDIDLLGFALPWDEYIEMTKKIYQEFSHYPMDVFLSGRKQFLKEHFFSKDRIYHTPYFYENYESLARDNFERFLKREII